MLKVILRILLLLSGFLILTGEKGCDGREINTTALDEQSATEVNQQHLLTTQPPPRIDWSLERDNLIKRSKLQNDRSINFYMYVFIEGIDHPIGYYLVNKVSSVDSQLTNTMQIVSNGSGGHVLPSPAEDGSYGTNGNGVFGFTPDSNPILLHGKICFLLLLRNPLLFIWIGSRRNQQLGFIYMFLSDLHTTRF